MPAINGVKKSAVVKGNKKQTSITFVVLTSLISMMITAIGFLCFWNFHYQEKFTNEILISLQSGETKAYKAIRDISSGEYLDGAVEEVIIPSTIMSSDLLTVNQSLAGIKASGDISANSLITSNNAFDPNLENTISDSTRLYIIDYIPTPGVSTGDYIDIKLKLYNNSDGVKSYRDYIVCSKIEVISKDESGRLQLSLSEQDIVNLNSAVIEAASSDLHGEIYVGKYVSPAIQPKAIVNYDGNGIEYTDSELEDAQDQLRDEVNNEDTGTWEYENSYDIIDEGTTEDSIEKGE